ncbi:PadR family transcriptional regulator [Desulfosporosinus sp. SB140]|uniref:PadR family transcriptional regulator n=1 Tax=Desulfosporosinus paludis TaxID=3115649 RepID=UPI0038903D3C
MNKLYRKIFLAFVQVHILHHANKEPFFGLWIIEELKKHGYSMSAGTLYPILHGMEMDGLLEREERVIEGKVRKYYSLTAQGKVVLEEAKMKSRELYQEIIEE